MRNHVATRTVHHLHDNNPWHGGTDTERCTHPSRCGACIAISDIHQAGRTGRIDGRTFREGPRRPSSPSSFPFRSPSSHSDPCPRGLERGCSNHETPETGQQRCNLGKIMRFGVECNEKRQRDTTNTPTYLQPSHSIDIRWSLSISAPASRASRAVLPSSPFHSVSLPPARTCAEKRKE